MIPWREILALGAEWQLDAGVIEKDYALGWLLAGIAHGGEILVSQVLRQLVQSSVPPETFLPGTDVELKGLAGEHTIYPVRWQ